MMQTGFYDTAIVSEIMNAKPFSSVIGILERHKVDVRKLFNSLSEAAVFKLKDFFDPDGERGISFRVTMMNKDNIIGDFCL
jgi:hypothetical protein